MRAVPERLFVDSGPWIAFASARDRHHGDAAAAFDAALTRRTPLVTSNLVVAEVQRLLLFRAGRAAALAFVDRVDRSPSVGVVFATAEHHRRAREWLARLDDQAISYTDAVSFAIVEDTRCTAVLTYDHDFAVAGFRRFGR